LKARSLTRAALSDRLGITVADLEDELQREPEPGQGILNDIAKELALPPFVFYMRETPPLHDILPDFRSATPAPSAKSRSATEAIQFAASIQRAARESRAPGAAELPRFRTEREGKAVENFALKVRSHFGITVEDQLDARDARSFYVLCRKKIEDKGIFVLHDSFPEADGSGFCLADDEYPVIVVNTKQQTRARRLFTLIHELAHLLLRKSGISDPFVRHNSTEKLCNEFAGCFLVPEAYLPHLLSGINVTENPTPDFIARVARRLKISQQATVLRLEELQIFAAGSHLNWLRAIHNLGNPDYSEKGGGANGPPPQEKVKLAKYGFHFAAVFGALLRHDQISDINLFRLTGLKPKFQRTYFDYASSITNNELQFLELDDD